MFNYREWLAEQMAACANMYWMLYHPDWSWEDDWKYWCNDVGIGTVEGIPNIGGW